MRIWPPLRRDHSHCWWPVSGGHRKNLLFSWAKCLPFQQHGRTLPRWECPHLDKGLCWPFWLWVFFDLNKLWFVILYLRSRNGDRWESQPWKWPLLHHPIWGRSCWANPWNMQLPTWLFWSLGNSPKLFEFYLRSNGIWICWECNRLSRYLKKYLPGPNDRISPSGKITDSNNPVWVFRLPFYLMIRERAFDHGLRRFYLFELGRWFFRRKLQMKFFFNKNGILLTGDVFRWTSEKALVEIVLVVAGWFLILGLFLLLHWDYPLQVVL